MSDIEKAIETVLTEDDNEPITEEWLKSSGFKDDLGDLAFFQVHVDGYTMSGMYTTRKTRSGWHISSGSKNHQTSFQLPVPPATRGDVRRIARVLGIELD